MKRWGSWLLGLIVGIVIAGVATPAEAQIRINVGQHHRRYHHHRHYRDHPYRHR